MKIFKGKGIIYAQSFMELLSYRLSDNDNIGCSIEMFNNCREQGYIVRFHNEDEKRFDLENGLTLFIHNNRWSDEPTITYENKETFDVLYSEEAFNERQISFKSVEEMVEEASKLILNKLGEK